MADVPFEGGEKLTAALERISRALGGSPKVRVGLLEGATYPNGTPVALVAAVQEYGAPSRGIPPRPAIRGMVAKEGPGWGDALMEALKASDYDAGRALELMGEGIKGQWQQAIRDFWGVPLAPATIARKGFDKQLIDTGHMINSVDSEVISGR